MQIKVEPNTETNRKFAALLPAILFGMAAIFLVVATVIFLAGRSAAADARLLAAEGVPAVATITNRTVTETRSRDTQERWKTTTSYSVELAFTTATGKSVTVERFVDKGRFDSLREGAEVEIFYLPSRPDLVGFEKGSASAGLGILWVFVGVFGLIGVGIGWLGLALRRQMAAVV
ncbi:MAG: DUF3592 domain-containing protein [Rhodobacterales bacterium]|nr:DUF3592 domain-containing protein [Rhodobacterales bacterium]